MKKIIVLGCMGSGKSYFSKNLSAALNIPVFHLDNIWWRADKTHISRDEFDKELALIMKNDCYIIDGDYSRTIEIRLSRCDAVFFFDLPQEDCINGIQSRVGQARADIPFKEDTLDTSLYGEVIRYNTEKRPRVLSLISKYAPEIHIFNTRQESENFINNVKKNLK